MNDLLNSNVRIIQTSKGRTGSTLLANILLGFFTPDKPLYFVEDFSSNATQDIFKENFIIKEHSGNFDSYINFFPDYNLYFIESTRNHKRMSISPKNKNHLQIEYDDFVETEKQSLEICIKNVSNKLESILPTDIFSAININSSIKRIRNMNNFYENALSNISWGAETDSMYGLHGSHRNRDRGSLIKEKN